MPIVDIIKNSFTSGELSPLARYRTDLPRYQNGAGLLENFQILVQGGVQRRGGMRYVATASQPRTLTILKAFEPGDADDIETLDAFILEFGLKTLRFYKFHSLIMDGEIPVEIVTPYQEGDLRRIRTAQSHDVMILLHPRHPPAQLSHLGNLEWTYKPIVFDPPPLYEAGASPDANLTPSALSGTIVLTTSAPVFVRADVDRVIQAADARVAITAYTNASTVAGEVLSAFTSLAMIGAGDWTIQGSPMARLHMPGNRTDLPSRGSVLIFDLQLPQDENPELLTNPAFASGLTGWTNLSNDAILTGTHTGGAASPRLTDSTKNFWSSGMRLGYLIKNTTTNGWGTIEAVRSPTTLTLVNIGTLAAPDYLFGGTDSFFDTGDTYEITGAGGVEVRDAKAWLTGGAVVGGWLQHDLTTVVGEAYLVTFAVSTGSLSAQAGSTSGASDLKEELSYPQGNDHEYQFVATTTTSYVQFRNNQPSSACLVRASVKLLSVAGWRAEDQGRYIEVGGGLVRILAVLSASRVRVEIRRDLTSVDPTLPGGWRLLEPAWSATLGYPSVVCFFEGRLYLAASGRFPETIWGSAVNDFYNFAPGPLPTDSIEFTIVDSAGNIHLNAIRWLMPGENLLAGTTDAEYRLSGPTEGGFTPTEPPLVRMQSTYGSDIVQPLRIGQALLFTQRQGSKLRQMAFDADTASAFLARDLSVLSGHLLEGQKIIEMAYQSEPTSVVWAVRSDGVLLGLTYDLLEEVVGWHHHTTVGTVESVAVKPHNTANAHEVWLVVRRIVNGVETRFIEYIDEQTAMTYSVGPGQTASWQGLTVDAGLFYTGVPTSVIAVPHLEKMSVAIVGDGLVFPPQVVTEGLVTLPQTVSRAFVGLPYVPRGELLPPEIQTQRGTSQLRRKDYSEILVGLYQTIGLTIADQALPFRASDMALNRGIPPFTGDMLVDALLSAGARSPRLTFSQPQPLPCTILALILSIEMDLDG